MPTPRLQPLPAQADPELPSGRFTRRVTLEDAVGLGRGPRHEQTALLTRAFESQHEVLEHYYGAWAAVAVALVREGSRERIEFACAPDVELEQNVEELLFRAHSLYQQARLTLDAGRDRTVVVHMAYGVIAGVFKELDRAAAGQETDLTHVSYLEHACSRAERYFNRAAQRRAQLRYLAGVFGGLGVIALVGALLAVGLSTLPAIDGESPMFLASLIGGGAGALLS